MKKTLILAFTNLKTDTRVRRQVQWASKRSEVTVVCFDANPTSGVNIVKIRQTNLTLFRKSMVGISLLLRLHELAYRLFHNYGYLQKMFSNHSFDFIIANDIDTLPLAFQLNENARIIFDAHEYAPRHFENNKTWKIFFQPFYIAFCKKYISKTDAMLTVGVGLAKEYEKNFGVRPIIVTNATQYYNLQPSKTTPHKIRLVHHGIVNRSRKIELMLEMMRYLDNRFSLDMYLLSSDYASSRSKAYLESLKEQVRKSTNIKILPPIESELVVSTINQYDIGVFLIPPVNFNYANTLPNKLFDFIQARLGIAIGPTPEMAAIVKQYNNGVVADDFTPQCLADQLNALTEEKIHTFKVNSAHAANVLNAEQNEQIFNNLIDKL